MKNQICVPMYRVVDDNAPFVEVAIMDKDAQEHEGLFLVDTCCTNNLLSAEMKNLVGQLCWKEGITHYAQSVGNVEVPESCLEFTFKMGDQLYHEEFDFVENFFLPSVGNLPILGILGMNFLLENHLAVDYSTHTIHTSEVNPTNLRITDCAYFFSLQFGLDYFGIPVVPIRGIKETETPVAMIDTGSVTDYITENALKRNQISYTLGKVEYSTGIGGSFETRSSNLTLSAIGFAGDGSDYADYPISREFFVINQENILEREHWSEERQKVETNSIDAMLGSQFLGAEGWIIDFGARIIYKPKQCA